MSINLGEKLQQAREARGITISEVAEQTRIAPLYLECIENNDYRTLPGGIFNKGFVKSYARYVGLDEQEALQDYAKLIAGQDNQSTDDPKTYRPEVLTDDRMHSSMLPTVIIAVIILGLMTGGILALVRYTRQNSTPLAIVTNQTTESNTNATNANAANANSSGANASVQSAPSMNNLKIEFRALNAPIYLSSTSDGKRVNVLVKPENPQSFEPKQNLRLSYAKVLASNAQLTINGKQIKLPSASNPPGRNVIELEINQDNIGRVWQSGEIAAGNAPKATPR